MKKLEFRLEDESVKHISVPTRGRIILGLIIVFILTGIFIADDWQQKRFATLRKGYHNMIEQQYEDALMEFEDYLDVDSNTYWTILEIINNEFYSRDGVKKAIDICKSRRSSAEFGNTSESVLTKSIIITPISTVKK